MIQNPNAIGASPQSGTNPAGNPQSAPAQPPKVGLKYGLTPEDVAGFRKNPRIIEVVRRVTGRDFPMDQIDDDLIIEIAGVVNKIGVDGAVALAEKTLSHEQKATIRGISMKQRVPMAPKVAPRGY